MFWNRKINRLVNAVIACFLFGFVVIFLKAPAADNNFRGSRNEVFRGWSEDEWKSLNKAVKSEKKNTDTQPIVSSETADPTESWKFENNPKSSILTGADVVNSMKYLNENFNITNLEKFGPLKEVKTVLVIQVHNRPKYLQYLIESLKKTKGIEQTLLVFSHDINVASINEMVRNIDFARVYQIFYPYNLQLFPHIYPGQSVNDCPEKIKKEKARLANCSNWEYPDKYGNYRSAKVAQIKHHWWWKMNFVFDGIIDKYHLDDAHVLILEEDHMLAPDALQVLDIIQYNKKSYCPNCEIISLGTYLKNNNNFGNDIHKLGVHPWYSSKHNMGMAFQKDTWSKIKSCSKEFCDYDDYNWDWSLLMISVKCLPQRFKVIFTKSPRVFHIGDCGVHTHRCHAHEAAEATQELFETHKKLLFPEKLVVTDVSRRSLKPSKANGGWGDKRDHQLCMLNKNPLEPPINETNQVLAELLRTPVITPTEEESILKIDI